jgi:hypothetical protein
MLMRGRVVGLGYSARRKRKSRADRQDPRGFEIHAPLGGDAGCFEAASLFAGRLNKGLKPASTP